jgi:hypothetical protein
MRRVAAFQQETGVSTMATPTKPVQREVKIPSARRLSGILRVPPGADGVIAFAHRGGGGRFTVHNQFVARVLEEVSLGPATLAGGIHLATELAEGIAAVPR